jgi:hypothetical protein
MTILDDLADMFPDVLTAQPGSLDAFGGFTPSGAALALDCYIEGGAKLVRDKSGQEVVSSVQAIVASAPGLTVDDYRYTLPARFDPREDLRAIGVVEVSDEDGALYEEVLFP